MKRRLLRKLIEEMQHRQKNYLVNHKTSVFIAWVGNFEIFRPLRGPRMTDIFTESSLSAGSKTRADM